MTSPDNILFHLSSDQEAEIRAIFSRLAERGFPPQRQTPHITVTFAPEMVPVVTRRAAQLLPPHVPAAFRRAGTVTFGTKRRQTVAWLLETTEELECAARELSALNPDGRGRRWLPHLTMGLRLPREVVGDYIRALDEETSPHLRELIGVRVGLWQPRWQRYTSFLPAKLDGMSTLSAKQLQDVASMTGQAPELDVDNLPDNPIALFVDWFHAACGPVAEPKAMTLATVDASGAPDARTVNLYAVDEQGFSFGTSARSTKAEQLRQVKAAALNFWWPEQARAVRVRGEVNRITSPGGGGEFFAVSPQHVEFWQPGAEKAALRVQYDAEGKGWRREVN